MYSSHYSDRLPPLLRSHGQVTSVANSAFRKRLFSTTEPTEIDFGYHQAIRKGPFIFVSGTTASKLLPELDAEEEEAQSQRELLYESSYANEAGSSGGYAGPSSRIPAGSGFVMAPPPPLARVPAGSGFTMSPEIPTTRVPAGSGFVVSPESPPPYEDSRSCQGSPEARVAGNDSTETSKQPKQSPEQAYLSPPREPYRQPSTSPPNFHNIHSPNQNIAYRSRIHHPNSAKDQARIALSRSIEAVQRLGGKREDIVRARIFLSHREDSQVVGEAFREALSIDTMAGSGVKGQDMRIKKGQAGIRVGEVAAVVTLIVVGGFVDPDVRVMVEVDAVVD